MESMLGFLKVSHLPTMRPLSALSPFQRFNFSPLPLAKSRTDKRTSFTTCATPEKPNNGGSSKWADLILDPDPDNIVAVGLTGLLTFASVSVLWQLLVISLAILLAALKYSLVAALLILILIALL